LDQRHYSLRLLAAYGALAEWALAALEIVRPI